MSKTNIKLGTKVKFHAGNHSGSEGLITKINWNSDDKRAIYGFLHEARLENGQTAYINDSDDFTIRL